MFKDNSMQRKDRKLLVLYLTPNPSPKREGYDPIKELIFNIKEKSVSSAYLSPA